MAIVMMMEWPGMTLAQYDEVKRIADIEGTPPVGARFHLAGLDGTTLRVIDLWESAEQFQNFVQTRLMPATQQAGVSGQPEVKVLPAHSVLPFGYSPK